MKKIITLAFCLSSLLGMSSCKAGGSVETTAVYQSVTAPARWSLGTTLNKSFVGQPPLYVVESGMLYLLIQSSWSGGVAAKVHFEEWTIEKLQNLVQQEKLNQFLPNEKERNGGISWVPSAR